MRKYIIGIIIGICLFLLLSYRTTEDGGTGANERRVYVLPLKQTSVVITQNKPYVDKLIKKGYIVDDVDVVYDDFNDKCVYNYTLIKY